MELSKEELLLLLKGKEVKAEELRRIADILSSNSEMLREVKKVLTNGIAEKIIAGLKPATDKIENIDKRNFLLFALISLVGVVSLVIYGVSAWFAKVHPVLPH